jgi:TDG/mug DNA glycosylase family protein
VAALSDAPLRPILGPGLRILFVGINPSLRSAEVGHHFARPGNRFWPTLHAAGFTPRRLRPDEDAELPAHGIGVTNIASRPTRAATELSREELRAGAAELDDVVRVHAPRSSPWSASPRTGSRSTGRRRGGASSPTRSAGVRCGCCRTRAG